MFGHKRQHIFTAPALATIISIAMFASQIPQVRGVGGITLDGTGFSSATSAINLVDLHADTTGLCVNSPGGVCPHLGDLVILQILLNNTGTVANVFSNQGLEPWTRRASVLNGLGGRMEEWYSIAPPNGSISNPSITVVETVSRITVAVQELAISGYDRTTPFDPNPATPAINAGQGDTGSEMSATITTNDPLDMFLGFSYGGSGSIGTPAEFTGICLNIGKCTFEGIQPNASEYAVVEATQTGYMVSMTQTGGKSWGFIADAIQSALPAITSVSPSIGVAGTAVTISGASFTDAITVTFCGTSRPAFRVVNDTSIITTAPKVFSPRNSQMCDIVVTNLAGSSLASVANQFSFLPSILSINPIRGHDGTILTITGSSFVGTTAVTLCGVFQPQFTIVNDTQIKLTVSLPGVTESKSCDLVVINPIGKSSTSGNDVFDYASQNPGGGSARTPGAPTSNKLLYIALASIAAVSLVTVAVLMRRWDPEKK